MQPCHGICAGFDGVGGVLLRRGWRDFAGYFTVFSEQKKEPLVSNGFSEVFCLFFVCFFYFFLFFMDFWWCGLVILA